MVAGSAMVWRSGTPNWKRSGVPGFCSGRSEWRMGVRHQIAKIRIEPLARLRRFRRTVRRAARFIEARCIRVRDAVGLARRLGPNVSVDQGSGGGPRPLAEPCTRDVAPAAPARARVGNAVAAGVDQEALAGDAGRGQRLVQLLDVALPSQPNQPACAASRYR